MKEYSSQDPLGVIPSDFLLEGKVKIIGFPKSGENITKSQVLLRLSYGGEVTRDYLYVLREYLNTLSM